MNTLSILLTIAGGVGLFLYGIKLMSEALQAIAGDRMRQLMGALARNPLLGILTGILVTVLIQSSTGTTVMTVSFVGAGLLTLKQAIGIIMGANVGTTVTAQIIAFKIESAALPLIALGAGLSLFGKSKRRTYAGNGIVGLGLLFLGMKTMEAAAPFVAEHQEIVLALSGNPLLGVLTGIVLTIVIQSSAATIGLTMALASQGLLSLDAAIPIILGDNLGTTLTAVLSAAGAGRAAKQAAAAHVLFNLLGTVLILLAFPFFKGLVLLSSSEAGRQIANAHALFNIVNTLILFPFIPLLARIIERFLPAEAGAEQEGPLYLDTRLLEASPSAAVEAVKDELMHMGTVVLSMLGLARRAYAKEGELEALTEEFEKKEHAVNGLNRAIAAYASEVWQRGPSGELSTVLGCYVSAAGDLERVGDHTENLMELCGPLRDFLSAQAWKEFWDMFGSAEEAVKESLTALNDEDISRANHVIYELESKIDSQEQQYRKNHIDRLNRGECDPERGVNFIDLLGNLERVGDHSDNIAGYVYDIAGLKNDIR
ncbi:MAG: Na/Pi cotransporter family protein [Synergistaceae bacterium]|nr:Na/Pi cotransporter family protein [Synergistaceae bacterium]